MAYSDAFRTEAIIRLAVNKYDYDKTAEQVGVTVKTLRAWEEKYPKKGVPELLERAIERMLMHIPEKWSGNEWAIALGILMDKWLLAQGKATERAENLLGILSNGSEQDRERIIEEAERILERAAGGGADPGVSRNGKAR